MAQKSPQRHPNELIELTTAFYSLVDATAARRAEVEERNGVSHPGRARPRLLTLTGRGGRTGIVWLPVLLTDSVRVAFVDRRGVTLVPSSPRRGRHACVAQYGLKGEKRAKTKRRAPSLFLFSLF